MCGLCDCVKIVNWKVKLWKGKNQRKKEEKEREKRERKKKKNERTESVKERKREGVPVYQIKLWGPWGGEQATPVRAVRLRAGDAGEGLRQVKWRRLHEQWGFGVVLLPCSCVSQSHRHTVRVFCLIFYCFLFWILDEICDLGWVQIGIGLNWCFGLELDWARLSLWL